MITVIDKFQVTKPEPTFMRFLSSIAGVPPGLRYTAIETEVRLHGDPKWECKGLRDDDKQPSCA